MEKFLLYAVSYLLAISVGVVVGMLIDNDNTYKVTIRKIKQKGEGNTLDSDLTVNLPPQTKRESRKIKRQDRRNLRKTKRDDRKLSS